MFLGNEAAFPYYNRSIKKTRIIWFGSISVDVFAAYVNNWQNIRRIIFFYILVQVWFALLFVVKLELICFVRGKELFQCTHWAGIC